MVTEDGNGGWKRVYWRGIFLGEGLGMSKLLAGGGGLSSIPTVGKILGSVVENIEKYRISMGISEIACRISRINQKQRGIWNGHQEKFMWNLEGSWFLALKFLRDVMYIILPNFQKWSIVSLGILRGTEINKNSTFPEWSFGYMSR